MTRDRVRATVAVSAMALIVVACESDDQRLTGPKGQSAFNRYVAMGTSVSAGTQSDGILYSMQGQSWTAQLARAAMAPFSLPLIQGPGCNAPIVAPLAFAIRLDKTSALTTPNTCAPLFAGISLPTNNVAIDGALAYEMLTATPETATVKGLSRGGGQFFARVLPPGKTQVTAMMQQNPTFVSVEVGANDIARTRSGIVAPGLTYTDTMLFRTYYDQIIDSVKKTGAKAVLVGLPSSLAAIPGMRLGSEIAAQAATLGALGVIVQADCGTTAANNLIFVTIRIVSAIATAQATGTPQQFFCSASPNPATQDYSLTAAEVTFINAVGTAIDNIIKDRAAKNGFAYVSLGAVFDLPKPAFNAAGLLSPSPATAAYEPYGPYVSLDGFHPNGAGQTLIAKAAAAAIDAKYGFNISSSFNP